MMRIVSALLCGAAGTMLMASAALAADVPPPFVAAPVVVAPPPAPKTLSAYVEGFGAFGINFDYDEEEQETVLERLFGFGGGAHLAWQPGNRFSIQTDGWYERWVETGGEPDVDRRFGGAIHATLRRGNVLAGGFASVGYGGFYSGYYANVGGEAAVNTERLRVYGQGGFIFAVGGSPVGYGSRAYYAQMVTSFYPRPNLVVSVNAGGGNYYELANPGQYDTLILRAGSRVEFQPEGRRFSIFGAYEFEFRNPYGTSGSQNRNAHIFGVGLSMMFGQETLRDRDRAIGLADYNVLFGPTFPH